MNLKRIKAVSGLENSMSGYSMRILLSVLCVLVLLPLAPARAAAQGAAPKALQQYVDWTVYLYQAGQKKICFATSEPKESQPNNVVRGRIVFYVTTWPEQNIANEVSVKIGYPFKDEGETTAEIGTDKFKLYAKGDKAYIAGLENEKRFVAAMRAGSTMIIKGVSKRGTLTTDYYSLSGISAALKRVAAECK